MITLVLFLGENSYCGRRRRQQNAEREAAKRKLGDEDSVGSSDIGSWDGDVYRLDEGGMVEAFGGKRVEGERRGMRKEDGHDHVLAMIVARP